MLYNKFEIIGKNLFGSSWKKQMADNLFIDHRRIQDWSKRGTDLPAYVDKELKAIAERRSLEAKFALSNIDSFDYHAYAVLMGETHHLDENRITIEDIEQFLKSQKYTLLQSAWSFKQNGDSLEEITEWLENMALSENDIAAWYENNECSIIDIFELQNNRSDNLSDIIQTVSGWFE